MKHLFIAIISILSIASCSQSSGITEDHTKLGANNIYVIIPEDFINANKELQSVYSSPNYDGFEFGIDELTTDYNEVLGDILADFPSQFHNTKKAIKIGEFEGTQFDGKLSDYTSETTLFGDSLTSVMISVTYDSSIPEQKEIWNEIKSSIIYKRPEPFSVEEFRMKKMAELMPQFKQSKEEN